MTWNNPFAGLDDDQLYDGLVKGSFGPRWPEEKTQRRYTGASNVALLRRSLRFVELLEEDGALKSDWKALDYGCGWGRFASLFLSKGSPDHLDLCDAWDKTIVTLKEHGFSNRIFQVPSLLQADSIPRGAYDFIICFSVFTHLSADATRQNIPAIMDALKDGGRFYLTVNHDDYLKTRYPEEAIPLLEEYKKNGFAFVNTGQDGENYGNTAMSPKFMASFGNVSHVAALRPAQHLYRIERN